MSDLQVALITLGALIIAGVVVYNWMQERKMRKNITDEFLVPQKDVLTEDFYIDADAYVDKELADIPHKIKITEKLNAPIIEVVPVYVAEAVDIDDQALPEPETIEPNIEAAEQIPIAPLLPIPSKKMTSVPSENDDLSSPLPHEVHAQIDLTAFLFTTKNISAQTLNTISEAIASDMGVPMMLHGMDANGKWHFVNQNTQGGAFKQMACSIQLADRGGPISKHVLNKFQFAVENMGLELGAHVEWQSAGDAMQRAIELDKFCMEVDQLISVHLIDAGTPIHGTKFKGLAEANGLTLLDDGRFHCFTEHSTDVIAYTLASGDGQAFSADSLRNNVIKAAVFQIEIPKVTNCEQVFNQVILLAKKMSGSLNAQLVDDNQKPLGDLQIEKIRQQLKVIHATMVARGVLPGSVGSQRLFN